MSICTVQFRRCGECCDVPTSTNRSGEASSAKASTFEWTWASFCEFLSRDCANIGRGIARGEDVMGSVVERVAEKNHYIDKILHFLNDTGCEFGELFRWWIMLLNALIGATIFSFCACACMGFGSGSLDSLPWVVWTNSMYQDVFFQFALGTNSPVPDETHAFTECFYATVDDAAAEGEWPELFPVFEEPIYPGNGSYNSQILQGTWLQGNRNCSHLGNRTLQNDVLQVECVNATLHLSISAEWHANMWGLCVYVEDKGLRNQLRYLSACASTGDVCHHCLENFSTLEHLSEEAGGAICRPWNEYENGGVYVADSAVQIGSLILSALGGFVAIVGPLGRMRSRIRASNPRLTCVAPSRLRSRTLRLSFACASLSPRQSTSTTTRRRSPFSCRS